MSIVISRVVKSSGILLDFQKTSIYRCPRSYNKPTLLPKYFRQQKEFDPIGDWDTETTDTRKFEVDGVTTESFS